VTESVSSTSVRDRPLLEVQLGHDPPHRLDRRLADQGGEVGADEAVGLAGEASDIDAVGERHAARVDGEDLAPAALVGDADDDLAVEAAGAPQRLVDRLRPVGGGDDDEVLARLQPVEQAQQLRDQPLLGLALDLAALGRDRIDLVDEDDRGRRLRSLLEQFAQALLALAIGRAHDLRAGDVEEIGVALVRDRARQPCLAGAGRTVKQDAARRIDAEPLENLGIAQRQLDQLAELVDRGAHAAEIVIGDVGAARLLRLGIFGAQLDLAIGVDMDDALGRRGDDDEPDLLQCECGRGQHLAQLRRDVPARHLLLAVGGDDVAGGDRFHPEAALQGMGGAVQAQILLRRGEDDPLGGLGFGLADLDEIARADLGIGALQAVEADDLQPLVLRIGADRPGRRGPLPGQLDDVALAEAQLGHQSARQPGDAAAAVLGTHGGDLEAPHPAFFVGHRHISGGRAPHIGTLAGDQTPRHKKGADPKDRPGKFLGEDA
jgi:hypothetical protein